MNDDRVSWALKMFRDYMEAEAIAERVAVNVLLSESGTAATAPEDS